jgi:hypothetical protein
MTIIRKSDHKRASLTLYHIVALNAEIKLGYTINKVGAAQVLADLLQIDRRAPMSWLRGSFIKHPLSRENFLKFVRAYRKKPGLENAKKIVALAISLYGSQYKRAIELLDPADQESNLAQDIQVTLPGKSDVVTAIYNLLESSPEAIEIALGTINTYQWTAHTLLEKLRDVPDEIEIGTDRIISVAVEQLSDTQNEAFSKLGGLPELALYNLDCFETIWEKTDKELADTIALFEKLNFIWAVKDNEWKIKPHVLSIARQYLTELPENIQLRAYNWWKRFLDKSKYLKTFRSHLISRHAELDQHIDGAHVLKQQNKIGIDNKLLSFSTRLNKWFFVGIDADWECMQSFSQYMSYENFVFAQFILKRHKGDLLFGFLISLCLGAASLLSQAPVLMGCAISAGVYALFRVLIDLYRCDIAWAGLWETLTTRAKSAQEMK